MGFIKHVGKHGDRKVAVLFRKVPGEEHMALVIYPETLSAGFHDSIMKVIEGETGQQAEQLSDAMHRSLLPDGRPILATLHKEGKIKKVQTNQIIITPNATSHVRLDELNKIVDGMDAGDEAAKAMAEMDANAGLVDPNEQRRNAKLLEDAAPLDSAGANAAMTDAGLGSDMLKQSKQMAVEGASLVAESKRLEKEAFKLNPALKPKRAAKKATPKKKAAVKKA